MADVFQMFGGPLDGGRTLGPSGDLPAGAGHGRVFEDWLYVFTDLGGRVGWHYAGKVTWTPQEHRARAGTIPQWRQE